MKKLFYNLILPFTFVALLMFSVIGVSQFRPFFSRQYHKLDRAEYIGIAEDDLMAVTDGLLSYMAGGRENLDMQYEVKGVQREIFDEREKLHMIDVKNLYLGVIYIASALAAAVAAMTAFVVRKDGAKAAMATLNRKYRYVAIGLVLVVLILGIMIITNFQKFWISFHKVFFTNDLWLLDPAVSIMINMFPLEFFYAICMAVIAVFIVLGCIVKTVLAIGSKK